MTFNKQILHQRNIQKSLNPELLLVYREEFQISFLNILQHQSRSIEVLLETERNFFFMVLEEVSLDKLYEWS